MSNWGTFEIDTTDLRKRLSAVKEAAPKIVAKALFAEASIVLGESQTEYVPVDTGVLKNSGFVAEPKITSSGVEVELGYGGAAAAYAVVQHERLDYRHTVGQAKFLEIPVLAWGDRAERTLGDRIGRELEKGGK